MPYDNFGAPLEPPQRRTMTSILRWVSVIALILLFSMVTFVLGWIFGKNMPRSSNPLGNGLNLAPAPADWTEWKYPDAVERSKSTAGPFSTSYEQVGRLETAILATPDSYEKVLGFYGQKLAQPMITMPNGGGTGTGARVLPAGQELNVWSVDTLNGRTATDRKTGQSVSLQEKVITYRTTNYDLMLVISRANSEKETHICISYMPLP